MSMTTIGYSFIIIEILIDHTYHKKRRQVRAGEI